MVKVPMTHTGGLLVEVLVDPTGLVLQEEVRDLVALPHHAVVVVEEELLVDIPVLQKIELLQTHNLA